MTRRRHTPDQIIRKLAEGNKLLAAGRARRGVPASRDRGLDVASLGRAVRRHEDKRREAPQGTRSGERASEAPPRRRGARQVDVEGIAEGNF